MSVYQVKGIVDSVITAAQTTATVKTLSQLTDEKQQNRWHLTSFPVILTTAVWTDFNRSPLDHGLVKGQNTHLI